MFKDISGKYIIIIHQIVKILFTSAVKSIKTSDSRFFYLHYYSDIILQKTAVPLTVAAVFHIHLSDIKIVCKAGDVENLHDLFVHVFQHQSALAFEQVVRVQNRP